MGFPFSATFHTAGLLSAHASATHASLATTTNPGTLFSGTTTGFGFSLRAQCGDRQILLRVITTSLWVQTDLSAPLTVTLSRQWTRHRLVHQCLLVAIGAMHMPRLTTSFRRRCRYAKNSACARSPMGSAKARTRGPVPNSGGLPVQRNGETSQPCGTSLQRSARDPICITRRR